LARARDSTDAPQAAGAVAGLAQRKTDSTKVIPALRALLGARDFTVVSSAAGALGQLGDSASVPSLASLLARVGTTDDADIRAAAASALAAIKASDARAAAARGRRVPPRRSELRRPGRLPAGGRMGRPRLHDPVRVQRSAL